jgi:predicted kinase
MSQRSRRGEPLPDIPIPPELMDKKPKKVTASTPGTEYVTDPTCESDAEGLKGEVFLNYVYRQLKSVESAESAATVERPTCYIMMGPPAAGKSSIKRTFNITNYVNIDLDEIKKILIRCFPNEDSVKGFAIIGNLRRFAKQLLQLAIRDRMNILFDTTGRMTDLTTQIIEESRAANYRQCFIIVYTSLDNCLARAASRNVSEPDRPPMSSRMITEAYESFINKGASTGTISYYLLANRNLTSEAEELYVFDNNGSTPEILFKRVDGVVEVAKETPDFYNMSINSSEPYFTLKGKAAKGGSGATVKSGATRRRRNNKRRISRRR